MSDNQGRMGRIAEVLLVEDNDNDAELTRICFRRTRLAVNLHHVRDGEECMAFLRREAPYADAPRPDLILLDLNMPRMNGLEVLEAIGADAQLRHLPVVVLTTSDSDRDVSSSYRLRCSSYIVKPVEFDNFVQVVQTLTDYWFTLVVLPGERPPGDR